MTLNYYDFHTHNPKCHPAHSLFVHDIRQNELPQTDYYVAGIHPWYIQDVDVDEKLRFIEQTLEHPECVGLGEIGLDKTTDNFDLQLEVLQRQLNLLTVQSVRVVVFHCVRAYSEILEILKKRNLPGHIIIHDFNSSEQMAEDFIKRGAYLSFGRKIFDEKTMAHRIFSYLPLDHVLLETDDQDKRTIEEIYTKAAALKKLELEELTQKMHQNFQELTNPE